MAGLADAVLALLLASQDPPVFEGVKVVEVPESRGAAAVKPGDVLLLVGGRAEPGAPAWRRRIADSLGTTVPVRLLRDSGSVDLNWDVAKGTYRLAEWPDPSEHFRRDHASSAADESVQAATKGIQAALAANGRTALRLLRKARDAGLADPVLDWAEADVLVRYQNQPVEAASLLERALAAARKQGGAGGRRVEGWCHVTSAYRLLMHRRDPQGALREITLAHECGSDVADISLAVAAALPRGSGEAYDLRRQVFREDPLDVATCRWLAESASTPQESAEYSAALRRLRDAAAGDPLVEFRALLLRLKTDASAAEAVESFIRDHPTLPEAEVALAWDGLADHQAGAGQFSRELAIRVEALQASPTTERTRSLARAARKAATFTPALEAIRSLRRGKMSRNSEWEYFRIYEDLLQEAYGAEGVPVLEEAVRLKRLGRREEAVDYLAERSDALLQPELRVAAGLMLREAGDSGELDPYFQPELEHRNKASEWGSDWASSWRLLLVSSRAQYPAEFNPDRLESTKDSCPWEQQSTFLSMRAAVLFNAGKNDEALKSLKDAAQALGRPGEDRSWVPVYAEGRICRGPRDYIGALNEKWKAGLSLPPPAPKR